MAVTKSTLASESWNIVYDALNNNITDPKARGLQWIFSAFPDTKKWPENVDVFPVITVESPNIKGDKLTLGRNPRMYTFSVQISIFDTRMDRVDSLSNQIFSTLENYQGTLHTNKLDLLVFDSSPITSITIGKERIHNKDINITMEAMLEV